MYSGSFSASRERSDTRLVCVALNRSVCLSGGRYSIIASTSRWNPISMIRSASSSTSMRKLSTLNPAVCERCCNMRPGVQTTIFILPNASLSSFKLFPPIISPAANRCPFPPTFLNTSKICIASSRVGLIITAPNPASGPIHCARYRFSNTGITNAKVFPLPVFAAPRISLPLSASGMARAWMSVSVAKCAALRPARVGGESGRSEKAVCVAVVSRSLTEVERVSASMSSRLRLLVRSCFLGFVGRVRPVVIGAIVNCVLSVHSWLF